MPETQGKPLPDSIEDVAGSADVAPGWEAVADMDDSAYTGDDSRFVIATAEDTDALNEA